VLIEAKDDGGGGDNWSYKSRKAPVKSSPPTNQHPTFYRPDALPEGKKIHIPWNYLPKAHLGSSNFVSDHPGYLGGGLPCLSSAL